MLSVTPLNNPTFRREHLAQFLNLKSEPRPRTWVVSDLRSKFEIQTLLLEKNGYFEDVEVIRASELWRLLLRRLEPEYTLIGSDLVRAQVKDQLEKMEIELGQNADQAVCDFMDQMSPVLFHPEGSKYLYEWFAENPLSHERWGAWYKVAEKFSDYFLQQKKVAPHWVAPLLTQILVDDSRLPLVWQRDLIFDLGGEMLEVESELIQILARHFDCSVLMPSPPFAEKYKYLLMPYENLLSLTNGKRISKEISSCAPPKCQTFRFSGMLGEIKHAVATTRRWLEEGVKPTAIVITAPDIEIYWPVLAIFLKEEGIPCAKEMTARMQTLPVMAQWLSILKLKSGQVTSGDLETAVYGADLSLAPNPGRYEKFQSLFRQLLDPEDLGRWERIAESFQKTIKPEQILSLDQFLGQALQFWTRLDLSEILEVLLKEILSSTDRLAKMQFSNWLFYLERVLAKKEIRIEGADSQGIIVTNLLAGDSLYAQRRIFLGLSESQLKKKANHIILPKEVLSFNQTYGFYLNYPEASQKSFELEWLALSETDEDHYCFPLTKLDGTLETPSQYWMHSRIDQQGEASIHNLDLPEQTRWDEVQQSSPTVIFEHRHFPESLVKVSAAAVEWEIGRSTAESWNLQQKPTLSASSFEKLRDCPFIFASEKVFSLSDLPDIDLDLDRMSKGSFSHRLVEELLKEPLNLSRTESQLAELIDRLKVELNISNVDPAIWQGLRNKNIQLAMRFQREEKKWRAEYPQTETVALEEDFSFAYNGYQFRGKIDRLDSDQNQNGVLIDYKSSASRAFPFKQWFDKNTLQLLIYSWALDQGYIEKFDDKKIVAAFYYVLKNFDRSSGFKLIDGPVGLYDLARKKSQISPDEKKEMYELLEKEFLLQFEKLTSNDLAPAPRDIAICETCHWRPLCRAPHLT